MNLRSLLLKIPEGRVTTYGELARCLGTSPRAVGAMLHRNPEPVAVPCHRVVMSDGRIGGYAGGVAKKVALLRAEGVGANKGKIADFGKVRFLFS